MTAESQAELFPLRVERVYHQSDRSTAYGTYYKYKDAWYSAYHVLKAQEYTFPSIIPKGYVVEILGNDIVRFADPNDHIQEGDFPEPVIGQKIHIMGYPEGSHCVVHRTGKVYVDRDISQGTWIIQLDGEPVVSGMSGSPVFGVFNGKWVPIGVLTTQNSPMGNHHYADFQQLAQPKPKGNNNELQQFRK